MKVTPLRGRIGSIMNAFAIVAGIGLGGYMVGRHAAQTEYYDSLSQQNHFIAAYPIAKNIARNVSDLESGIHVNMSAASIFLPLLIEEFCEAEEPVQAAARKLESILDDLAQAGVCDTHKRWLIHRSI